MQRCGTTCPQRRALRALSPPLLSAQACDRSQVVDLRPWGLQATRAELTAALGQKASITEMNQRFEDLEYRLKSKADRGQVSGASRKRPTAAETPAALPASHCPDPPGT